MPVRVRRSVRMKDIAAELGVKVTTVSQALRNLVLSSSQRVKISSLYGCLKESGIPYLLLDRPVSGLNTHFVGSNDKAIGEMATQHLIERGYRRIAHIGLSGLSSFEVNTR